MDSKTIELIKSVNYVSFDIFDTLIQRNINEPSDLFQLVQFVYEDKYSKLNINFKELRVVCEHKARKKCGIKEISIDDIYILLKKYSKLDSEIINQLKSIELELEENLTTINSEIYGVYKYCIEHGKSVIITSDMYLPLQNVENILKKQNIKFQKLYLSSQLKLTKSSGDIYDYIIKDLNCNPSEILHIGDNFKSDFTNSKNKGLKSVHYIRKCNKKSKITYYKKNSIFESIDKAIIKNNYSKYYKDYWIEFGIENIGILYYNFIKWMINDIRNKDIDKVCFFSRDGYILKNVYDLVATNLHLPESDYFLASRRALNIPSLERLDQQEREMLLHYVNGCKITTLFKKIGLNSIYYKDLISSLGFDEESTINLKRDKNKLEILIDSLKEDILKNSSEERKHLLTYIKEKAIENKNIVVVDIGWNGTLQWSLNNILESEKINVNIIGYYFGLNKRANTYIEKGIKMKGFLYELNSRKDIFDVVSSFNAFFEELFIANHGSLIRFKEEEGIIKPCFEEFEYSKDEYEIIKKIQEGALIYIKEIYKFDTIYNFIETNPYLTIYKLKRIFLKPTIDEVKKLGGIIHFDYEKLYNCKPTGSILTYIARPSEFIKELKKTRWKIGFIKYVFKLDIFCWIYVLVRRLKEKYIRN